MTLQIKATLFADLRLKYIIMLTQCKVSYLTTKIDSWNFHKSPIITALLIFLTYLYTLLLDTIFS